MPGSDPGFFSIHILSEWFGRGERGNIDRAERTEELMNEYAGVRAWIFLSTVYPLSMIQLRRVGQY
jgi:hypothetical protein